MGLLHMGREFTTVEFICVMVCHTAERRAKLLSD